MLEVYYNDVDPFCCAWIKNLISAGELPDGDIDSRSIEDVQPDDVRGYRQAHFFAGIAGFGLALKLAGMSGARLWSGSCPCQPWSNAGKRKGNRDERHLWPHFHRLISACLPPLVVGEQVEAAMGFGWLDDLYDDLETSGYDVASAILPASSVGAPHIRSRLWWVGNLSGSGLSSRLPSKLVERLCLNAPEFNQRWDTRVTPRGRVIPKVVVSKRKSAKEKPDIYQECLFPPTVHPESSSWPTPDAQAINDGESLESFQCRQAKLKIEYENGNGAGMPLAVAAHLEPWRSPDHNQRGGCYTDPEKVLNRIQAGHQTNLEDLAVLSSPSLAEMASARATDCGRTRTPEAIARSKQTGGASSLEDTVHLAPMVSPTAAWVTPSARDHKDTPGMAFSSTNPDGSHRNRTDLLPRQVFAFVPELSVSPSPWATPTVPRANDSDNTAMAYYPSKNQVSIESQAFGITLSPSGVVTESTAESQPKALNPKFSLWLMGYPDAWDDHAPVDFRLPRKPRVAKAA